MRIVTWNCNLRLARKLDALLDLKPDIAIVQECEEALSVPSGYAYIWRGNNPRKGLGVLSRGIEALLHPSGRDEWTYFLPLTVPAQRLRLLATWAYNHRAGRFGPDRVGNPLEVVTHLSAWLSEARSIVAGDFNNSIVWDKPGGLANFAEISSKLSSLGLRSAYHSQTMEVLGAETCPTYFHTKKPDRPYHIDYCFVHSSLTIASVSVLGFEAWRAVSDHVPVVVDLNDG